MAKGSAEVKNLKKIKPEYYIIGLLVIIILILIFYLFSFKNTIDTKLAGISSTPANANTGINTNKNTAPEQISPASYSFITSYVNKTCDEFKNEILQLVGNSFSCSLDSDCGVLGIYCGKPANNNYIPKIEPKLKEYNAFNCPAIYPTTGCSINRGAVKCQNNKCIYA